MRVARRGALHSGDFECFLSVKCPRGGSPTRVPAPHVARVLLVVLTDKRARLTIGNIDSRVGPLMDSAAKIVGFAATAPAG